MSDTPQEPSFRTLLTFQLHSTARLSERVSEEFYKSRFGLSLSECRVIGVIGGLGPMSFKEMAGQTHLEKSHASRIVASLVERGILNRREHPGDSRSILLELTEPGRALRTDIHRSARKLNAALEGALGPSDIQALRRALAALETRLQRLELSAIDGEEDTPPTETRSVALDRNLAEQLRQALDQLLR
jgi:DNA-binding MarR family transcriptional regulator